MLVTLLHDLFVATGLITGLLVDIVGLGMLWFILFFRLGVTSPIPKDHFILPAAFLTVGTLVGLGALASI